MLARPLILASVMGAALGGLVATAVPAAAQGNPVTALGGALEPLGPETQTAAQRRSRDEARRAIGLGRPNAPKTRRHLQLINRISSRIAREQGAPLALDRARLERQQRGLRQSLSVPVAATCLAPPQPSPYSQFTLPAWADATRWSNRSQYGTIQLADVTGDKGLDVIGRSSTGVLLADFEGSTGTFSSLAPGPPLADDSGWNAEKNALTIRSGDIDGDGQAEIVALDASAKVVTFDPTAGAKSWSQLPDSSTPDWNDRNTDWSQPTHYETLRLVDLDGDGTDELLARASRGIISASFDPSSMSWKALPSGPDLSDAKGWDNAEFSSTIRIGELDGRPGAELVALNAKPGFEVHSYSPTDGTWSKLGEGMPAWPAGSTNWRSASTYSTVRLANLDGDPSGVQELLVRSRNGLVVARWNTTGGAWTALPTSPVLANVGGWNKAKYYESLRVGDVDADGADEVFIRGGKVLEVIHYRSTGSAAASTAPWTVSKSAPLAPSAWKDASNYRTFTLGDVDGDGDAEVLGRDAYGVRTFDYADGDLVSAVEGFPAFSGAECAAYNAINQANAAALNGGDLRASYADLGVDLNDLAVPGMRPPGVTSAAWAVVAPQITDEIRMARKVRTWHLGPQGMSAVIATGFSTQAESVNAISTYFPQTVGQSTTGEIFPWIAAVAVVVGVAAQGETIIGDAVSSGITAIFTFVTNETQQEGNTKLILEKDKIEGRIAKLTQQATDANNFNATHVPREWGLMQVVADSPLPAEREPWQAMWRQSDIYFWQTFAKDYWDVSYCDGPVPVVLSAEIPCSTLVFDTKLAFTQFPMKGAWQRNTSEAYWISTSNAVVQPQQFREATQGNPPAHRVMFDTPPRACRPPLNANTSYTTGCKLGLDPADVYLGRNGWDLPTMQLTLVG